MSVRNEKISQEIRYLKTRVGLENESVLKIEHYIEKLERECCGLKQQVKNYQGKEESYYRRFYKVD